MERWMTYSLAAFLIWGVWGFLGKLASRTLGHKPLVVFSLAGYLIVFLAAGAMGWGRGASADGRGALLAVATGWRRASPTSFSTWPSGGARPHAS